MLKTLIYFLIIFSVIVVIHEYGHLFWAKRVGILVREFSLGMGPKLYSHQAEDGTTYTIRMLPLGGYVRLAGLNEEEEIQPGQSVALLFNDQNQIQQINTSDRSLSVEELAVRVDKVDLKDQMMLWAYLPNQEDLQSFEVAKDAQIIEADGTKLMVAPREMRYEAVSVKDKILTNFGGPLNNFILSIITFMIVGFLLPGIPSYSNQIGQVVSDSPAEKVGLMAGDRIVSLNDQPTKDWNALTQAIGQHGGETVRLTIDRGGQTLTQEAHIDQDQDGNAILGIMMASNTAIKDRLLFGFTATWNTIAMVVSALASLFTRGFDLNLFGGPVAIAQATSTVAKRGILDILAFTASLSANLGIINLLPIPALDGGKIVLNLIEGVRGKPLSQEKEGIITLIGVGFLFILMLLVTWNDIMRAFF